VADALENGDVADPEQIEAKITAEPLHSLELASAAVFRIKPDGSFARLQAYGWPPDRVDSLPASLPLIERLARRRTGAVRLEAADLPEAAPEGPAFPSVAVPIFCAGDLHAIAFYGAHSAGDDINSDEIKALEKLGRAASVACQNVELVSLRRRLQDLKPRPTTA
jgi:hypothetical protein